MTTWFQSPAGWYVLGFTGQLVFASRFVIQWWASERQRRVIVPGLFWYLSLVGGAVLFLYAWHKRDPVFVPITVRPPPGALSGEFESVVVRAISIGHPEIVTRQALVDMLTEKAAVELPSPVAGKVVELKGNPGDKIAVGGALCA